VGRRDDGVHHAFDEWISSRKSISRCKFPAASSHAEIGPERARATTFHDVEAVSAARKRSIVSRTSSA
jgi:hypothetical protein